MRLVALLHLALATALDEAGQGNFEQLLCRVVRLVLAPAGLVGGFQFLDELPCLGVHVLVG